MKEIFAAKVSDLSKGEMKLIEVDENHKILLCRTDDGFFAVSHTCPHYGAPLEDGILVNERIICPWHHSCFNAKTGDMLEPPSIQSLVKFNVKIIDDNIILDLPDKTESARVPDMIKPVDSDINEIIIIGGGAAGYMSAQTLREEGFTGKIRMITPENKAPYDRPNLSKDYLAGNAENEWMPLRSDDFYKEYNIEIITKKSVKELQTGKNLIIFEDGMQMNYSKLIIATGGIPVKLNVQGSDLENIFYLRSWNSSDEIIKAAERSKKIVIIGGSFIGMEAAFHIRKRTGADVTVVIKDDLPFEKVFGTEIGRLFYDHHKKNGINFVTGTSAAAFEGNGKVNTVILKNGEKIKADIVIAGIGVKPATSFIKDLELQKDGSIKVDEHFCAKDFVYAAGDIASFPDWRTGDYIRIEHWRTALQQGRHAALCLSGNVTPFRGVPFFWTRHGDMGLLYVGHTKNWDDIIFSGDISSRKFIAYYVKDNKVLAAAGMNKNKDMAVIHELFFMDKVPGPEELKKNNFDLKQFLKAQMKKN